jgi:SAM-dependent methyltransferase
MSDNRISKKEAAEALLAVFDQRTRDEILRPENIDYFYGSYDRWSLVIAELSKSGRRGKILDIGAWDGLFLFALRRLGYDVAAIDWHKFENAVPKESLWQKSGIEWHNINVEADPLPFQDCEFSGVYMGQVLEHFTYSPFKPMKEILRVLKPGGLLILDVPNVGELHNFYRLVRGKNVLYDYKEHYIDLKPFFYKGLPYFERHNREFTADDLRILADTCGFEVVKVAYIRSVRHNKKGFRRIEIPFSYVRDLIPLFRKSLMLVAKKPEG